MKKKILFIVLVSFLITGVVSAASMWGDFKGKPIIRLTVDGEPVKVSDAPAVLMDGRTMIPIYLLSQAGVKYTWDGKNQTVDVKKTETSNTNNTNKQYAVLAKKYKSLEDDAEFFLDFAKTMEFYYLENLNRSTTKEEDNFLRAQVEEVRTRYTNSVSDNQKTSETIYPITMNGIYSIQNNLFEAANNYVKSFDEIMIWKYTMDRVDSATNDLDRQAAKNSADKTIQNFDKYTSDAQNATNKALDEAKKTFDIYINLLQ